MVCEEGGMRFCYDKPNDHLGSHQVMPRLIALVKALPQLHLEKDIERFPMKPTGNNSKLNNASGKVNL